MKRLRVLGATTAICATLVLGGCASSATTNETRTVTDSAAGTNSGKVTSTLQLGAGAMDAPAHAAPTMPAVRGAGRASNGKLPMGRRVSDTPKLNADGTINDGPDPFTSPLQVMPLPVEDDAKLGDEIDRWSRRLREIDITQWDTWMRHDPVSPWEPKRDALAQAMVRVYVERCGGAQMVASGTVLAPETVVTSVHAIESVERRPWVQLAVGSTRKYPAMVRWLNVDDDVAILKVPGLRARPMLFHQVTMNSPQWGYALGIMRGGTAGELRREPAMTAMTERKATVEQPDGFGEDITYRAFYPSVAAVDSGASGGAVVSTNDSSLTSGWGYHGMLRARIAVRSQTAAIVTPAAIVGDALNASDRLPTWSEIRPGSCPQWLR